MSVRARRDVPFICWLRVATALGFLRILSGGNCFVLAGWLAAWFGRGTHVEKHPGVAVKD